MNNVCNNCGWAEPPLTKKDSLLLCTLCLQKLHNEEPTKPTIGDRMRTLSNQSLVSARDKASQRITNLEDPTYYETISMDHPEFYRALEEYDAGNFTLTTGEQDPLLFWIAQKIHGGYELPSWGMDSFRKRCAFYCEQRYSGEEMEPYQQTGEEVQEAVDAALVLIKGGSLNKKDTEVAKSISEQFRRKNWITKKQVMMLNILREKQ